MRHDSNSPDGRMPEMIGLVELEDDNGVGARMVEGGLGVVQGVKVRLSVVVGEAELTIGELMNLRERQTLALNTAVDAPVDILLDGKVVARGQLVAVEDSFGVQITETPRREAGA